ncbi:hypothetical protein IE4803_CH00330 [Rhizobium etli bv. phaseoli str. IE4803]|nr:hypothetical protein IE4803_CH00330 [Rhizobium etli bv. phaseoli str. IE4803]
MAKREKNFRGFCEWRHCGFRLEKFILILTDFIMFFPRRRVAGYFRHHINMLTNVTVCNTP